MNLLNLTEFAYAEMQRCVTILKLRGEFSVEPETITVRCDLRGRSRAGVAIPGKMLIRLSPGYFAALGEEYRQTVAHEYAHIVARRAELHYGVSRDRSHGARWRHLMRLFGFKPERTLSGDRLALADSVKPARRVTRYVYEGVNCGHVHKLTAVRHVRARNGTRYFCCKEGCITKPDDERGIAFTGRIEKS